MIAAVSDRPWATLDSIGDEPLTYRALKLGSLAAATFDNVVEADLSAADLLLGLSRRGAGGIVSAAVAVHAITVCVVVCLRPGAPASVGTGAGMPTIGTGRSASSFVDVGR